MGRHQWTDRQEHLLCLLRALRKKSGLTQVELAQKLGRPQSFVSKCESGERRLDILELQDICKACEAPIETFILEL